MAKPALAAPSRDLDGGIVTGRDDDPEIMQAEAEARRTLPLFWRLLADNPQHAEAFAVKAAFKTNRGFTDYLWIADLKRVRGRIMGRLENEPDAPLGLHVGSPVTVTEDRVIDWTIAKDGRQYGHYTTRVLAKHHPKQAEELKSILSPTPLSPGLTSDSH
jgi:uncharacterized protein YegJ (DUF2314 family)